VIGDPAGVQQHHIDELQSVVDTPQEDMRNCYILFFWASCMLSRVPFSPRSMSSLGPPPHMAVGVAKQTVGTPPAQAQAILPRGMQPSPVAGVSLRRTTVPPFPTFPVFSATTLEHGTMATTHPASGTPSPEWHPSHDDLLRELRSERPPGRVLCPWPSHRPRGAYRVEKSQD